MEMDGENVAYGWQKWLLFFILLVIAILLTATDNIVNSKMHINITSCTINSRITVFVQLINGITIQLKVDIQFWNHARRHKQNDVSDSDFISVVALFFVCLVVQKYLHSTES